MSIEPDFDVPVFRTPDSDPEFEWESRESSGIISAAAIANQIGSLLLAKSLVREIEGAFGE